MKLLSNIAAIVGIVILTLTTVGCGGLGQAISRNHTFSVEDSLTLSEERSDLLTVVQESGQALSLDVAKINKSTGTIIFQRQSSMLAGMSIGKINAAWLSVSMGDDGKKLNMTAKVTGNFGGGTQDAANKLLTDFKSQLTGKLGKTSIITPEKI